MSFWGESPGPTWSDFFWSMILCKGTTHAFPLVRGQVQCPTGNYAHTLHQAHERESEKIAAFLREHFKITERSACVITGERIRRGLSAGWIVVFSMGDKGEIMGCCISRPLGECRLFQRNGKKMRSSSSKNTGFIDFFCVIPSLQKSGLGSTMLRYIRYSTSLQGRLIHFFQKEVTPLRALPPLWCGKYIVRYSLKGWENQSVKEVKVEDNWLQKTVHQEQVQSVVIATYMNEQSGDTKLFRYTTDKYTFFLAITDTFSVEKGTDRRMGEVLSYWSVGDASLSDNIFALETILDCTGYKILLMDSTFPHDKKKGWQADAPYYYYIYNLNPRQFFTVRPWFWF